MADHEKNQAIKSVHDMGIVVAHDLIMGKVDSLKEQKEEVNKDEANIFTVWDQEKGSFEKSAAGGEIKVQLTTSECGTRTGEPSSTKNQGITQQ